MVHYWLLILHVALIVLYFTLALLAAEKKGLAAGIMVLILQSAVLLCTVRNAIVDGVSHQQRIEIDGLDISE